MSAPETYRGWPIEQNWLHEYEATHPDFDPTPIWALDGPADSRFFIARTREDLFADIDDWIVEHGE